MALTAEDLNLREYDNTNLGDSVQPECDLIREWIEDVLLVGSNALEVGPGNGRTVAYLLREGFDVLAIDKNPKVLM